MAINPLVFTRLDLLHDRTLEPLEVCEVPIDLKHLSLVIEGKRFNYQTDKSHRWLNLLFHLQYRDLDGRLHQIHQPFVLA